MYGETFRSIRKSKNISQKDITRNCIHQTSYSKFELNIISLSFDIVVNLLKNMDMTPSEFIYINNGYKQSDYDEIIQTFFSMNFIDIAVLEKIVLKLERLPQENQLLIDIYHLSKGLIKIKKTGDFDESLSYANKVWERLKKYDSWYLSDIYLINNILFLFPPQTAVSISHFAIAQLQKYNTYDSKIKILIATLQFNIVHLLIRNFQYKEALSLNELVIATFKENKRYYQLSIAELRKYLLLTKIYPEKNYSAKIEELFILSKILDDKDLFNRLTEELNYLEEILNGDGDETGI